MRLVTKALTLSLLVFFITGCSSGISREKIKQDKKWNAMMAEKNKRKLDIQRKAQQQEELEQRIQEEKAARSPRIRCEIPEGEPIMGRIAAPTVYDHMNHIIKKINLRNVTCKAEGNQLLQIDGRNIPIHRLAFRDQLYLALSECRTIDFDRPEFLERNVCVVSIERGVELWIRAINDKRISDAAFSVYLSTPYGIYIDFRTWALTAYYYRKVQ